jgi:hypothetical protein
MLLLFLSTLLMLTNYGLLSIKFFTVKFIILCPPANKFLSNFTAYFFSSKIHKIHTNLLSYISRTSPHIPCPHTPLKFDFFTPASVDEISKLIDEFNDLDPIPSPLLKQCTFALIPTVTNIINLSLAFGVFPDQFQSCSVHPLLKKPNGITTT